MSLDELRRRIDGIDDHILRLLHERARTAIAIADAKLEEGRTAFYDPDRERRLLARLARTGDDDALPADALRAIYREIIAACLALQRPLEIAFLGPEGTFSEQAARSLFGESAHLQESASIDAVFQAVERGHCARGVVPIENATEGLVAATLRALLRGGLRIERELVMPVRYSLVSAAPSLTAIRSVASHPQALGQCRDWLATHLPLATPTPAPSTAAALPALADDPLAAALTSSLAASRSGLPILARDLADDGDNATRFVVIGSEDAAPSGHDRTALAFDLPDTPGALHRALSAFERAGVNMVHLHSLPSRRGAWAWTFFCEVEGHRNEPPLTNALPHLEAEAEAVRILGSFPRAPRARSL